MTDSPLSANLSVPGSGSTSEPSNPGSGDAGPPNGAVAADPGERILVGQERTVGCRGMVQITPDGLEFIVGVNPNSHPFNWSLAVITREHATALRDWLDQQITPARQGIWIDADGCPTYADGVHRTIDHLCPCGWRP